MKLDEFRDLLDRLKATSSRNEKESIIREVEDNSHAISFLSGSEFDDAGLGKKTVLSTAQNVYDVSGKPTVSDSLIPHDGGDGVKELHHLHRDMEMLASSSGNSMKNYLEAMFEDYSYPSVVAFACLNDEDIGVGDSTIAKAMGVKDSLPFYDGVHEIAGEDDPLTGPEVGSAFSPMLAVRESRGQPDNPVAQTKLDGHRMLVHIKNGEPTVYSRRKNDITESLPEVQEIDWPEGDYILDGEVLAENDSYSDTSSRIGRKAENVERDVEMHFHLFDTIVSNGVDITHKAFGLRHLATVSTVRDIDDPRVKHVPLNDDIEEAKDEAAAAGKEGIIVKDKMSPYVFGKRSSYWQKVKMDDETVDVVIAGFHEGEGNASGTLGKVELESADGVPLGNSGSGFTDAMRDEIWSNRDEWLGRCIEVEARGLGTQGGLRMPIYKRDRSDDGEPDDMERIEEVMQDV